MEGNMKVNGMMTWEMEKVLNVTQIVILTLGNF
jgi:hypothetical protein